MSPTPEFVPTPEDKAKHDKRITQNKPACIAEVLRLRDILDGVEKAIAEAIQGAVPGVESWPTDSLILVQRIKALIEQRQWCPPPLKRGRPKGPHKLPT